jgi:hypothetical protein
LNQSLINFEALLFDLIYLKKKAKKKTNKTQKEKREKRKEKIDNFYFNLNCKEAKIILFGFITYECNSNL